MSGSSTRILSWQQLVMESDPDFQRERLQPWVYQFSNNRMFYAPVGLYSPLPDSGLLNDGGVLMLTDTTGYPSSTAGLSAGAVWSNGFAVGVVSGGVPQPGALMFFPGITASQLLANGAFTIPTISPAAGSTQIWNNSGVLCVA